MMAKAQYRVAALVFLAISQRILWGQVAILANCRPGFVQPPVCASEHMASAQ